MLNVVIYTPDFSWAGGIDLLHGMVKGLLAQRKRECRISVLVYKPGTKHPKSAKQRLKSAVKGGYHLLRHPSSTLQTILPKRKAVNTGNEKADYDNLSNIIELFSTEDVEIVYYGDNTYSEKIRFLQSIGADVVIPCFTNTFPAGCAVPWVGYIFDFVYKYHSHYYTKDFCINTDINFLRTLLNAKATVVNSKRTRDDIFKFVPYAKSEVFTMPFSPFTSEHLYERALALQGVAEKYGVSKPYFMISNQFWLHKSHETAFEALKVLAEHPDYAHVQLICTGRMTDLSGTDDRRNQLLSYAQELGVLDKIHFLGHIPKDEQLALMLNCVSVIQPTLFEGGPGGGSVYMAVANGVPAIISDIEVNKEIEDEPLVSFFETLNAKDLAEKMAESLKKERKQWAYQDLDKRNRHRLELLGNRLIDCIEYTIAASQN